jgi:pyruvate formate lyase activating enzyme
LLREGACLTKGTIFNIQRYSIEDGPGIRTTVFVKGCPLRCLWCSNPESQKQWPEVEHRDFLCNKCGRCIDVCDAQAISIDDKGIHINRKKCTNCAKCVEVCIPEALKLMGEEKSVDEVFQEINKDLQYYRTSGGGVTVSGGEPLSQPEFTAELFKRCREAGIHTCLDTCGYAEVESLAKVLPYTCLVLFDLKHIDPVTHRNFTMHSNKPIIRNLKLIAARGVPFIIRVPLIAGFNDSDEALTTIARTIVSTNGAKEINLLPYHKFGMGKYKQLDRRYKLSELERLTDTEMQRVKEIFDVFGLNCQITT